MTMTEAPSNAVGQQGEGGENSQNNSAAATGKKRRGAPLGNRNAVTHGLHTVESRERAKAINALVRDADTLIAQSSAALAWGRAARARLMAPPDRETQP
jgi:uncharacterized protein YjcR